MNRGFFSRTAPQTRHRRGRATAAAGPFGTASDRASGFVRGATGYTTRGRVATQTKGTWQ